MSLKDGGVVGGGEPSEYWGIAEGEKSGGNCSYNNNCENIEIIIVNSMPIKLKTPIIFKKHKLSKFTQKERYNKPEYQF